MEITKNEKNGTFLESIPATLHDRHFVTDKVGE